jgi:DNA (cytosine-5)-methyltransferase 1
VSKNQLTLGSLFDGIGGWLASATDYGIKPLWSSEIERFPLAVTHQRFPDVEQIGDIRNLDGGVIPPVDIICMGSPCQGLSLAGKREGLEDDRSGLFREATRIIREMRQATDGKYPRFVVWENVPGAFSSNKGMDFRSVLQEIGQTEIPMPENGKWANAGMAELPECEIAWRVLDAQYWGVPQRRRRIFLVADFATDGRCAAEILFEPESVSGNTSEGESQREGAAEGTERSIGATGEDCVKRCVNRIEENQPMSVFEDPRGKVSLSNKTNTLSTAGGKPGQGMTVVLGYRHKHAASCFNICSYASNSMKSGNPYSGVYRADKTRTLDLNGGNPACNQGGTMIVTAGFKAGQSAKAGLGYAIETASCLTSQCNGVEPTIICYDMTHADEVMRPVKDGIAPTLNARMGTGGNQVPVVQGGYIPDTANTLTARMDGSPCVDREPQVVAVQGSMIGRSEKNGPQGSGLSDVCFTLNTVDRHAVCVGNGQPNQSQLQTTVGSLNCMHDQQCVMISKTSFAKYEEVDNAASLRASGGDIGGGSENLCCQSFVRRLTPTECERLQGLPDGYTLIEDKSCSDSARYKALGNGMAKPCSDYMLRRLAEVIQKEQS